MKAFILRLLAAFKAFWQVLVGDFEGFEVEIARVVKDLEYLAEEDAKSHLNEIKSVISRFDHRADITWKDLHIAYIDIIEFAASGINRNIATINHAAISAVNNATGPLNDRIYALEQELKKL